MSAMAPLLPMPFRRALAALLLALLGALAPVCGVAFAQNPAPGAASGFVAVPPLAGRVNDHANMLSAAQRASLEQVLADYETRTGSQIVILLVDSTAPEAIEQYGIRVADTWKPGRAKIDDGVILIVAKDNPKALRRLRIEAGRGVQGSLTDAQSKRVLEDVIAPHFRQNDFYGGLSAGVAALAALLDKEDLPVAARTSSADAATGVGDLLGNLLPILLFFAFAIGMMLLRGTRGAGAGNRLNDNHWGNAAGVIIGSILSQSGRGGGGFGGGGGGSGGGFSGGGGGFDGGGASGDW
ncbi:MAG: rane protein [Herbaspirillum sp.]|nr:rane protein [Herbaspirillum sp.]